MPVRRAFRLIEWPLVRAVLAVVTAIALPRYGRSLAVYRAEAAARRIAADLSLAQAQAREASADRAVQFDVTADLYEVEGVSDPDHTGRPYRVTVGEAPYHARLVEVRFDDNTSRIVFNGYGSASTGGIVVVASADIRRTVAIDAVSGKARVQ